MARVLLGNVKGATGDMGATGATGATGADGLTPYILNGTWWLGSTDTNVTAEGNKWIFNAGEPTTQGNEGDLYLDTSTYDIYKKISSVWTYQGNIKGAKGDTGEKGDKGDTALSVTVGTVTTGDAGTQASVTNVGTDEDLVLDFVIPKGDKGDTGEIPQEVLDSKLDKNLGIENAGKYLQVGNDGEIQTVSTDAENDVIEGYYYNGAFYEESTHTTQIVGMNGKIYIDLAENLQYRYNGTSYVALIANVIDDTTTSQTKTYSSTKIEERLSLAMGDIVLSTSGNTVSIQAKDINGTDIGTVKTITLPDELSSASFDTNTKELILTLVSGNLVKASYANVYKTLQDQIDELETKKVNNADYITAQEIDNLWNEN